jgi:hypothetical protein
MRYLDDCPESEVPVKSGLESTLGVIDDDPEQPAAIIINEIRNR